MLQSLYILFVEDHADTLDVLSRILQRKGHRVVAARSMAEALAACKTGNFDLLISDISLPDGDGHHVLHCCRSKCLRAVALTGRAMPKELEATRAAGFDDVLVKPIRGDHLITAIEKVMRDTAKQDVA